VEGELLAKNDEFGQEEILGMINEGVSSIIAQLDGPANKMYASQYRTRSGSCIYNYISHIAIFNVSRSDTKLKVIKMMKKNS
jgi:hypothetical protein